MLDYVTFKGTVWLRGGAWQPLTRETEEQKDRRTEGRCAAVDALTAET